MRSDMRIISRFGFFLSGWFIPWHLIGCGWLTLVGIDPSMDNFSSYIPGHVLDSDNPYQYRFMAILLRNQPAKNILNLCSILRVWSAWFSYSNIANILSKKDPAKTQYLENMEKLSGWSTIVNFIRIGKPDLKIIIHIYGKKDWDLNERSFLAGLPKGLKTNVALYLKKRYRRKNPFISKAWITSS